MSDLAILTGDLVGSRQLPPERLQAVLEGLKEEWQAFAGAHPGAVVGGVEIFRGDGWQVALSQPALALEAAVYLRAAVKAHAALRQLDSRVGIGIGPVDHLDPARLGESHGAAFEASGTALESLTETKRCLRLILPGRPAPVLDGIVLPLLDAQLAHWSKPEAVAVMGSLLGWTQERIATHPLSRKPDGSTPSQQSVADALKRIGWPHFLEPALHAASRHLHDLLATTP